MRHADAQSASKSQIFQRLRPEVRAKLLRSGRIRAFAKGTALWKRGDRPKFVYVILQGRIGVVCLTSVDQMTVVDMFREGAVITGAATLIDSAYLFSGKALDDSRVLLIPVEIYRRYLRLDHSLALGTALSLIEDWHRLTTEIRNLKQLSANQRLGCYLLAMTDQRAGQATVRLTDDQVLIAGVLGVTRESLSRGFSQLRAQGVSKRGRLVTITDMHRLREYCAVEAQHHRRTKGKQQRARAAAIPT